MERWIIIILLIFALITTCEGMTCGIINGLLNPKSDVLVHCKSENDDLGVHQLQYNASFEFHFSPNFWGTTQFYCSFVWPSRIEWFDVYKHKRDAFDLCLWMVKHDGPCRFDHGHQSFDDCFKWNNRI
ncbi:hypothetical protein PRUPE_1G062800 [Prunus persica]|uniref:S-protein homolog n=1 Tax=Prunus persica TaxID=3760 RepID=A0A251QU98_PRUPE|nr:hypothetical protein PRUPE_1G062800 [Prunus persica]